MLSLFRSIFTNEQPPRERYPRALIEAAIERAVDGTDPRIRAISRYARKLEPAVLHAVDHVVEFVNCLPAPVDVSGDYGGDPYLPFLLGSRERMRELVSAERSVLEFRETPQGKVAERIVALLVLDLEVKSALGVELTGDLVRRDVKQVTIGFAGRRLVDPALSMEAARPKLRRRAFDHILGIALRRITRASKERSGLEAERTLLRRKLRTLESAGWTFDAQETSGKASLRSIETELAEIERQLEALGGQTGSLQHHLDQLIEVLAGAGEQVWLETRRLIVDRMGIQREKVSDSASEFELHELHNALGRTAIAQLVSVDPRDVLPRPDAIAEARRYLG